MTANTKKPDAGRRRASVRVAGFRALYGTENTSRLPANWRERLPAPATYYARHVGRLGKANATGWAQAVCPFHDDRTASLSLHVADPRGSWRCFAGCGGGDLAGFHMRLTGLPFADAVRSLLGVVR